MISIIRCVRRLYMKPIECVRINVYQSTNLCVKDYSHERNILFAFLCDTLHTWTVNVDDVMKECMEKQIIVPVEWCSDEEARWCVDMEARLSLRRRTSSVEACLKVAGLAKAPVRRRHREDSSTERRTVGDSGVPSPPDPYSSCNTHKQNTSTPLL